MWDAVTCQFPNFIGTTADVSEWINTFTLLLIMDVYTCPCSDYRKSMFVKGAICLSVCCVTHVFWRVFVEGKQLFCMNSFERWIKYDIISLSVCFCQAHTRTHVYTCHLCIKSFYIQPSGTGKLRFIWSLMFLSSLGPLLLTWFYFKPSMDK